MALQHRGGAIQRPRFYGKSRATDPVPATAQGFPMSRSLLALIIVLVVAVGALFVLAGRARERPQVRVEKVIPLANLS